jgi:hypothetical protein
VLVSLAPKGDALIDDMAPLIELQYRYLEQAFGKNSLESLSAALEDFIAAQVKPVQRVALPPVSLPPPDGLHSRILDSV